MVTETKISVRQFGMLVTLFSIGTPILIIPAGLASLAKQDAWLAAVLGVGLGLLITGLYCALGSLFPAKSLVEMNELVLGKWIGKTISITFVFFNLVTAAELLFFVGNFLTTQIMPETPIQSINIIFACVVLMGVRLGIETLARSAEMLFPLFFVLFLILAIFVSPQIKWENIQPVLETDMNVLFKAVIFFTSVFSISPVALLMIFPASVDRLKEARKAFLTGTLIGGVVLIIIIALAILVLGAETTARQMYPSYALAKKINVGSFLQRIEIVMAGMWFITIFFRVSCYFYASVIGLAQTLNLKDYRFLVLPLGILMIILSLIVHPNIVHSEEYNKHEWITYAATYGLLLPLLLLGVNAFRKKGKESQSQGLETRE
ncbi:germination protein [Brevibacillus reuszeri]|uniref:GerAB/ArcD/ProY family transporter n=1 Tax=Brevibacillus reuszeri TaxID=54915 RepID=UPI001B11231E|nr:endospore germination permease [Brevibacillus reuszeri]GIO04821.1 germination protein [Brevibacillus reuszeri]